MKLRNPFRQLTDEEVIASARKSVEWCARYRRMLMAWYFSVAILVVVLTCVAIWAVDRLLELAMNPQLGLVGFIMGLIIGSSLGFAIIQAVHYFAEGLRFLTRRLPQEQMLVRYHDTLAKVRHELHTQSDVDT
ncbi:MAG: hypothetical protein KF708_24015 [Pirellulales bacterium]|nr:hypothetical protein [Pirellulales bacterium]